MVVFGVPERPKRLLHGKVYGESSQGYLDQFGTDNVRALVILDGTPKPKGDDPAKEWVETDEGRWWGTITPIEDRPRFHREFAQWLLEEVSAENIAWVTEIAAQTSGTVTALLNAAAYCVDYEAPLVRPRGPSRDLSAFRSIAASHGMLVG